MPKPAKHLKPSETKLF